MRRIIFYLFYDKEGIVDGYVPYKLKALREHAETIFVVSNSKLTAEGRTALDEVADVVWVRDNVGFDVGAFDAAMTRFGSERLAEYDELVLMNYTFFGPVYPFSEVFDRMAEVSVDFWGLSSHGPIEPGPGEDPSRALGRHLQTNWIAVRRPMFTSLEWTDYWASVRSIRSYQESIQRFEATFTQHFADRGFSWAAAWRDEDYPTENASFESAALLLRDRFPILKRRIFFHESAYVESRAVLGRRILEALDGTGYPAELVWRNVVRAGEPRHLYTNFSLLEILDEVDTGWRPEPAPRIAVLAHMFYDDMTPEVMSYLDHIPVPYDLYVTTTTKTKRTAILEALERFHVNHVEVRIVADNRGRDTSAMLLASKDVFDAGRYDLICRVHSKKSPQDSYNTADLFKHHMFDNLLWTPGYVANVLRLFQEQPTLGMVFPPVINIGYPTLGHAWFTNRPLAQRVAHQLGLSVVFDSSTPIAPYGSMFWARPEAMRKLVDFPWAWTDFPDEGGYRDGGLPHVLERLLAYTVLDAGYHVRSVMNRDWASINYAFLEYKLQKVAALLPAQTQDQLEYLQQARAQTNLLGAMKSEVDRRYPRAAKAARPGYRMARAIGRRTLGR